MKVFSVIAKILAVLSAVIGAIYVLATYGDKIVAWARSFLNRFFDKRTCFFDIDEQMETDEIVEEAAPVAEAAAEA
jgi:hypothetical protein